MLKKIILSLTTLFSLTLILVSLNALAPTVDANRLNGRSPFTAATIQDNTAKGTLAPTEEEWHQFSLPGPIDSQLDLDIHLIFSPNTPDQSQFVSLDVFSAQQLESWYLQQGGPQQPLGVTAILPSGEPNTGHLLWQGGITLNQTYYVRVVNDSDFTLDYQLWLKSDQPAVQPPPAPAIESALPPSVETTQGQAQIPAGTDPNFPIAMNLQPREVRLVQGKVAANSDRWFSVSVGEVGGNSQQPLDLTLFATPSDGNIVHHLHMDLFPGNYPEFWSRGEGESIPNFGAGRIVSRDGDDVTAELVWNGVLFNLDTYYVRVRNDNPFEMDYWLFTGDIINAELGEPTPPPVAVYVAPGTDPNNTLPLETGLNEGHLAPGQERWFSVSRSDLDGESLEALKLSLYFTPNDGNSVHHIAMELFDAGQNHIWSRGDTDQMRNFGAGTIIQRDDNPETGELYWDGWLIDGGEYYVRLRNDNNHPIDYWLFTDNIINPDLGNLPTLASP